MLRDARDLLDLEHVLRRNNRPLLDGLTGQDTAIPADELRSQFGRASRPLDRLVLGCGHVVHAASVARRNRNRKFFLPLWTEYLALPSGDCSAEIKRMPTLGEIIRDARERKGWSQTRLAREIGVSRTAVGQWENDETAPTRRHAPVVARVLDLALGAVDPRQAQSVRTLDTTTEGRTIPVIKWEGIMFRGRARGEEGVISVDPDTPADAVAMRVIDDAMSPEIMPGELIVVSQAATPNPDDIVIAAVSDGQPLLRRYNPRGVDRAGAPVFDLLSTSPDWPTITCNSVNGGKVLGVVVSHIRKLRRT